MSEGAATGASRRWEAPHIGGLSDGGFVTASQLEELQRQAYEEGRAQGYRDGLAAGEAELKRRLERLDELLAALAAPYALLDDEVERNLTDLAVAIAKQLFRRELRIDPTHIVGVIREAIALLPGSTREVCVRLHPEDAALVAELLASPEGERSWTIAEDPLIERGGCRVVTESSQIDARTERRFEALVKAVVGDER